MVESVDAQAFQQRLWEFETVPDIVRVMDLQQEHQSPQGAARVQLVFRGYE